MRHWIWASGCFSLLTACGDGLVSGDYPGEPLVDIVGEVLHERPIGVDVDHPMISLFWRDDAGGVQVEQSGQVDTHFPARYVLSLYLPPFSGVIQPQTGLQGAEGAIGVLLLYQDNDNDGQWDPENDNVIGASDRAIAWFNEEIPDIEPQQYIQSPSDCLPAAPEELPLHTIHADLQVADFCSIVPDLDCNGRRDDWPGLCDT